MSKCLNSMAREGLTVIDSMLCLKTAQDVYGDIKLKSNKNRNTLTSKF